MNKLLIICYGYDGKLSNNANAICLDEILDTLSKNRELTIMTTTENEQRIDCNQTNVEIIKLLTHTSHFKKCL